MSLDMLSHLVPMVTTCLSFICSTILVCRLGRLPAVRRKRLLVRQLRHLGAANLMYTVSELLHLLAGATMSEGGLLDDLLPLQSKTDICVGTYVSLNIGAWIFLLLECHLAVTFMASIYGSTRMLQLSYAWLAFVWPLGIFISLLDSFLASDSWAGKRCKWGGYEYIFGIAGAAGFLICLSSYIVSSFLVRRSGHAVQRSVWRRACLYPAVALVTLGPEIFYCIFRRLFEGKSQTIVFLACDALYDASGLLTYAVYASQNRYLRPASRHSSAKELHDRLGSDHAAIKPSDFRVNFRNFDSVVEPSVEEPSVMSSSPPSFIPAATPSFIPAATPEIHDIVEIRNSPGAEDNTDSLLREYFEGAGDK